MLALAGCARDLEQQRACALAAQAWAPDDETVPAPAVCLGRPPPRDLGKKERLAVAVYHFNIQYVAGGLAGFLGLDEHWSEAAVEDLIVRVGLEPLLDIYLAHPSFHADIELQAYMIEVIAQRHPDVLDKMRTLAATGQIDFDSFHYSDQLYVAYPRRDLEVSLELTRAVFERACLPLGPTIFAQEGQFARGQLALAQAHGYTVSVLPKNLFAYQFGPDATGDHVLFADASAPEHTVIIGAQGWSATTANGFPVHIAWTEMDDGEIILTENRLNPYFAQLYVVDPARVAALTAELLALEAQGFTLATIGETVASARARGAARAPLPPVLDGTWQPNSTNNVGRWMGQVGLFHDQEDDAHTLAAIWRARQKLVWAETHAAPATRGIQQGLRAAWRELLLAEVSDATGWNPIPNEWQYSLAHARQAETLVDRVITCAGVDESAAPAWSCVPAEAATLASLGVTIDAKRPVRTSAERCSSLAPPGRLWRVTVEVDPIDTVESRADDGNLAEELAERTLVVRAPIRTEPLQLLPAVAEQLIALNLGDYARDELVIPLPGGLIGLGGGHWLLQDHADHRLAAHLDRANRLVSFVNEAVPRSRASRYRFLVASELSGARALALAEAVNGPFGGGLSRVADVLP